MGVACEEFVAFNCSSLIRKTLTYKLMAVQWTGLMLGFQVWVYAISRKGIEHLGITLVLFSLWTSSLGKKGEQLATTSLEFEYLHRKSQCKMLIGGDDISNDVITLGTCFSMFVYIHACFHLALICRNLTAQSTESHRGIGGGIQIPQT